MKLKILTWNLNFFYDNWYNRIQSINKVLEEEIPNNDIIVLQEATLPLIKNVDTNEDLDVIDNDTEILEIEEEEDSIESVIVNNLGEEDEKGLDSDLDEELNDEIQTDEDLSFIDEDLGAQEKDISVEVEDEEDN